MAEIVRQYYYTILLLYRCTICRRHNYFQLDYTTWWQDRLVIRFKSHNSTSDFNPWGASCLEKTFVLMAQAYLTLASLRLVYCPICSAARPLLGLRDQSRDISSWGQTTKKSDCPWKMGTSGHCSKRCLLILSRAEVSCVYWTSMLRSSVLICTRVSSAAWPVNTDVLYRLH